MGHQPPKEYPTHPHKHVTSPVHEAARFILWALFWAGISVELIAYFMYKGEWGDRMDHYRPQRFGFSDGGAARALDIRNRPCFHAMYNCFEPSTAVSQSSSPFLGPVMLLSLFLLRRPGLRWAPREHF